MARADPGGTRAGWHHSPTAEKRAHIKLFAELGSHTSYPQLLGY